MSDPLYGWDLTFKTIETQINKKSDVLVAFTHFNLVKRGFRCIGVGDDQTLSGEERSSELLPNEWNQGQHYSLRYKYNDKLYILKGILSEESLVLNLLKAEDLSVSSLAFNVEDTVKAMAGSIDETIPEYKEVMHKLKRDMVEAICERSTYTTETQTIVPEQTSVETIGSLLERPRVPDAGRAFGQNADPLRVGRSDLDPFTPGGGGMIFDPFSNQPGERFDPGMGIPGGLPRGSVPPGARFDPFGPPGALPPRRRPPPDSDDFLPPGNYFM